MVKKIKKHGNSWVIVIERAILELLKINPETPLEISTDGKSLIVTPLIDEKKEEKKTLKALK